MSFVSDNLGNIASAGIGLGTMLGGAPLPTGTSEAAVGLSSILGYIFQNKTTFEEQINQLASRIADKIQADYMEFLNSEGEDYVFKAELQNANDALEKALENCLVDRSDLAKASTTPHGFVTACTERVMNGLANVEPELFGADCAGTLSYRYATDTIRIFFEAFQDDHQLYQKIEFRILLEVAHSSARIEQDLRELISRYDDRERIKEEQLAQLSQKYWALEGKITILAGLVDGRSPENLESAIERIQNQLLLAYTDKIRSSSQKSQAMVIELAPSEGGLAQKGNKPNLQELMAHLARSTIEIGPLILGYCKWEEPLRIDRCIELLALKGFSEDEALPQIDLLAKQGSIKKTTQHLLPADNEICSEAADLLLDEMITQLEGASS